MYAHTHAMHIFCYTSYTSYTLPIKTPHPAKADPQSRDVHEGH